MTTDNFTEAARIIDAHRENARWVGDGVKIECVCGHTAHATYDFSGPITEDKNNHRDAERMHAAHVAQVLAAQEPTDAEVEAAAQELASAAALIVAAGPKPWEWWTDRNQARFRNAAREALIRARSARRDEENR